MPDDPADLLTPEQLAGLREASSECALSRSAAETIEALLAVLMTADRLDLSGVPHRRAYQLGMLQGDYIERHRKKPS